MTGYDKFAINRLAERELYWVGGSKRELLEQPTPVIKSFGYRLGEVQKGNPVDDIKALSQFGRGVYELRENFDRNAFRCVYVVALKKGIYVLHVFMKKSKFGIGTPKPDIECIKARLRTALAMDEED